MSQLFNTDLASTGGAAVNLPVLPLLVHPSILHTPDLPVSVEIIDITAATAATAAPEAAAAAPVAAAPEAAAAAAAIDSAAATSVAATAAVAPAVAAPAVAAPAVAAPAVVAAAAVIAQLIQRYTHLFIFFWLRIPNKNNNSVSKLHFKTYIVWLVLFSPCESVCVCVIMVNVDLETPSVAGTTKEVVLSFFCDSVPNTHATQHRCVVGIKMKKGVVRPKSTEMIGSWVDQQPTF